MKLLYVDDNPTDRDLVRRALATAPGTFDLATAGSLAEARARLAEGPLPDLVLADLGLPDGSGLELLAELRERDHPPAVVVLTGSGGTDTAIAALKGGADDYLVKHGDYLQRLATTLAQALERHRRQARRRERPLRVLYVEHDADDLALTRRHLARHAPHIRLDTCRDVDTALARYRTARDAGQGYDLLLVDYQLSGRDGLELARELLEESGQRLPVVLVTGHGDQALVAAALRLGVADYLVKHPGYLGELVPVIEQAHRHGQLRAERDRLETMQRRLDHLLGVSPAILYAVRFADGRFRATWVTDNIATILGYSAEEALAPAWWEDRLHPDEHARLLADQPRLISAGRLDQEYRFRHADGHYIWVRDQLLLVRDADGTPREAVGAWNDVTGQHRVMERLRLSDAVLRSTQEGVVVTDLHGTVVEVNPAFSAITGYAREEILGKNPRVFKSGRHTAAFYQRMWEQIGREGWWRGEIWNRRKNGEIYPQWLTLNRVDDERGEPRHYVGVTTDLSRMKAYEEQVENLTHYDPLTGLPNRTLVQSRLVHALETAVRRRQRVAVLHVDLDNFKTVNDSLGHATGDRLLEGVALRFRERLRQDDTLGRLGGDEYLVLLENVRMPDAAAVVARNLLAALDEPFAFDGQPELFVRASIGICLHPEDGSDVETLVRNADSAVHAAKRAGRNRFAYYSAALTAAAEERLELESGLRNALAEKQFVLHYQPQVAVADGRVVGAEALLRWQHPDGSLVPPMRFVPLLEESGLILPVGAWVLRAACVQARAWLDGGTPLETLAVNLSAQQLRHPGLADEVAAALADSGLPAARLELEVTESMLMGEADAGEAMLHRIRALGCRIAIDDFGTGYSSLSYLKRIAFDKLKIDRSFITELPGDATSAAIAATVIGMARTLGLEVLAEGVEATAQLAWLRDNGCATYQGYLCSRPLPASEFTARFLAGGTSKD